MTRDSSWLKRRISNKGRVEEYDVPGEGVLSLAKRLGLELKDIVKLDANENFVFPAEFTASELRQLSRFLDTRLYPLDQKMRLTAAVAEYLDVSPDQIVVGNSSDDVLEIVARVFLKGKDSAISITPTFVMYRVITGNLGHKFIEVPLKEGFGLDVEGILRACEKSTHVCFLCSPNNPTGNQFPIEQVRMLAEKFDGLLVVDEAYVEYAPYSTVNLIQEYRNLIVLRTFSKAFGLAGLRIGYGVASPETASALKRIQLPYNVNTVSLEMALRVLKRLDLVMAAIEKVKVERTRLIEAMKRIPGVFPYASDSNFILFRTLKHARRVRDDLTKRAILIRYYDSPSLENYLRVTVGTEEMNDRFLEALKEVADV
jgi:histidinol-phosphate aminotransferase